MHRTTTAWLASGALALGLLLGGCAASPSEEPMTTANPEPVPSLPGKTPPIRPTALPSDGPLPRGTPLTPTAGPVPHDVRERPEVRAAIEAEAERKGVGTDAVDVVGYDDVTWPDGSIGCPQPGMAYTQALVPGRLLVLEVDGERASYHAGRGDGFAYCATPHPHLPSGAGDDSTR